MEKYALEEFSFALRRGSSSMLLHILATLLSSHKRVMEDMLDFHKSLTGNQGLDSAGSEPDAE